MESTKRKPSEYEASVPAHSGRQEEGAPVVRPMLYVRPELRREGDVRDVTLAGSPGPGESGNPGVLGGPGMAPFSGQGEGEGFVDEPEAQGQKKDSSGGEGAAFRNP